MAMSILYMCKEFARGAHHRKVSYLGWRIPAGCLYTRRMFAPLYQRHCSFSEARHCSCLRAKHCCAKGRRCLLSKTGHCPCLKRDIAKQYVVPVQKQYIVHVEAETSFFKVLVEQTRPCHCSQTGICWCCSKARHCRC